jgi:hypothetical protein
MLSVLLMAFCISSKAASQDMSPDYMVMGKATCLKSDGDSWQVGDALEFSGAFTTDRVIVGYWATGKGCGFLCLDSHNKHPLSAQFKGDSIKPFAIPTADQLEAVVEQTKYEISPGEDLIGPSQIGSLSEYPFAVFFSASKWGVTRREVWDMVAKGSGVQATTTEFGTLTTEVGNEGLVKIKFAQGADDKVNINLATVKLKDFTAASPSGVSSIVHECLFNPPVLPVLKNSWSATCTTTKTPQSGETTTKEVEVQISTLATESEVVNKKIDDFIAAVPNGQAIVSHSAVPHVWENGQAKQKPKADVAAVRFAEVLPVADNGWSLSTWLILANSILLVVVAIVYQISRMKPKS